MIGASKRPRLNIARYISVIAVIGLLGAASWQVYQHSQASAAASTGTAPSQTTAQPSGTVPAQPAYAAWPTHSNSTYGFSFNHPTDWSPSGDVTADPKASATRQEFGTGLSNGAATNGTVRIEVLDEPLLTTEAWYDQFYAQTPIKVNKTTGVLKGKQSIEYDFVAPTYETKLYLFGVGPKTYLFSSLNESLNAAASTSYWSDFDNVFKSLTIQK